MKSILNLSLGDLNDYTLKDDTKYEKISDELIQVLAKYDLSIPDVAKIINYTMYEIIHAPIQKDTLRAYLEAHQHV